MTKLVRGIGINDLPVKDSSVYSEDGTRKAAIFYQRWNAMLSRAYSTKESSRNSTYVDVEVCEEWRVLSVFKEWFDKNYIEGYSLDKDLLVPGNRIYSPETCVFLPNDINQAISNKKKKKSDYPIGVYFQKKKNTYYTSVNKKNGRFVSKTFKTPEEAHYVYAVEKQKWIAELLEEYRSGLCERSIQKLEEIVNLDVDTFKMMYC